MKKGAIIFDLDGTAVDSPHVALPSKRLAEAIGALKDRYFFSAATGRSWNWGREVLEYLGLEDPSIISAGTMICNSKTGEILWRKNIEPEDARQVIEIFREYPELYMLFNDYYLEDWTGKKYQVKDFVPPEEMHFFELVDVPAELAKVIETKLSRVEGITALVLIGLGDRNKCDIHVVHKEATKEQAVAELLQIIVVDKSLAIGIGDGGNDYHLFNGVGTKIAMGNAGQGLKSQADLVIGSVKEDGLAVYLESLA